MVTLPVPAPLMTAVKILKVSLSASVSFASTSTLTGVSSGVVSVSGCATGAESARASPVMRMETNNKENSFPVRVQYLERTKLSNVLTMERARDFISKYLRTKLKDQNRRSRKFA